MWNCGYVGRLLSNFNWFTNLFLSHAALLILSFYPLTLSLCLHFLWGFLRTRCTQCPPVSARHSSSLPLSFLFLHFLHFLFSSSHLPYCFSSSAQLTLVFLSFSLAVLHSNAKLLCIAGILWPNIWVPDKKKKRKKETRESCSSFLWILHPQKGARW